ncbi:MAG: hypothetical protein QM763_20425 [Agriterribacter sp.]
MRNSNILLLKGIRKIYGKAFGAHSLSKPESDQDPDSCAKIIFEVLSGDKPAMIARLGSTEMSCIANYLGVKDKKHFWGYIKGSSQPWWWEDSRIAQMQTWSGFFPPTVNKIEQFCELMLADIGYIDVLGSWLPEEKYIESRLKNAKKIRFIYLDPFWSQQPWTRALENKKVLVVHPFAETIQKQYNKRALIFKDGLLPYFELKTIKAVQSIAGNKTDFPDWFAALDYMKTEMDKVDYDICLIGAGAYGLPLAAHVKRMGKKGFHIGGSLQLLFGIRGKRWENPEYASGAKLNYPALFNEHWVRAGDSEKPKNSEKVEDNCYW